MEVWAMSVDRKLSDLVGSWALMSGMVAPVTFNFPLMTVGCAPSGNLQRIGNVQEELMQQQALLPFRGSSAGWRSRHTGNLGNWVQWREMQSQASDKEAPMQHYTWGTHCLGNSFAEKDLRVLVCSNLIVNQQCAIVAKMASSPLSCRGKSVGSRAREVTSPVCSALCDTVWHTWNAVSKLGLSSTGETWTYWFIQSSKGPWTLLIDWNCW